MLPSIWAAALLQKKPSFKIPTQVHPRSTSSDEEAEDKHVKMAVATLHLTTNLALSMYLREVRALRLKWWLVGLIEQKVELHGKREELSQTGAGRNRLDSGLPRKRWQRGLTALLMELCIWG